MSFTARYAQPDRLSCLTAWTGCALTPDARGIEVVNEAGDIKALAVFDHWTLNSAQAHFAAASPAALRRLIRPAFEYVFTECGMNVLIGMTPAHAESALSVAKGLGFKEMHRIQDGWKAGVDIVLTELRREDCRWIGETR